MSIREEFETSFFIASLQDAVLTHMSKFHVTKEDLANRIGTTPEKIDDFLSNSKNFSMKSYVKILKALNCYFAINLYKNKKNIGIFGK